MKALTNINRVIEVHDTVTNNVVVPGDTIVKGDTIYLYPTYTNTFEDKWIKLETEMNRQSKVFTLQVQDSMTIVHTVEKKLFKPNVS